VKTVDPLKLKEMRTAKSSLTVLIYSNSKQNIDQCKVELEQRLEDALTTAYLKEDKELVKTLQQHEVFEFTFSISRILLQVVLSFMNLKLHL